jgi:hypothetical protein
LFAETPIRVSIPGSAFVVEGKGARNEVAGSGRAFHGKPGDPPTTLRAAVRMPSGTSGEQQVLRVFVRLQSNDPSISSVEIKNGSKSELRVSTHLQPKRMEEMSAYIANPAKPAMVNSQSAIFLVIDFGGIGFEGGTPSDTDLVLDSVILEFPPKPLVLSGPTATARQLVLVPSVKTAPPASPTASTTSIWPNGKAYFFRGNQYLRYDPKTDKVDPGYPRPIAGNWPGFPPEFEAGVDAVVVWNNQKAYFFKGDQYLRYDMVADKVDPGYPVPIAGHWPGLWTYGINAAVVWPNGKAYFFKGSQYICYDIAKDKGDPGYPTDIRTHWAGFPAAFAQGIDDAVVWNNGKAYFFKGSEYIRYDIAADKTDASYPQPTAQNWHGFWP